MNKVNIIANIMLIVLLLTLFPRQIVRSVFSENIDWEYKALFLYIFMAITIVIFISILLFNNKTTIEKLGLQFPWKQFKTGWFIVICVLWILPNSITTQWSFPAFDLFFIYACFFGPFVEELVFRGFIQGLLPDVPIWNWAKLNWGVVLMAVFFSLWHFDILQPNTISPVRFGVGILSGVSLGILRNQTGSIWSGLIVHFLGNLAAVCHAR